MTILFFVNNHFLFIPFYLNCSLKLVILIIPSWAQISASDSDLFLVVVNSLLFFANEISIQDKSGARLETGMSVEAVAIVFPIATIINIIYFILIICFEYSVCACVGFRTSYERLLRRVSLCDDTTAKC